MYNTIDNTTIYDFDKMLSGDKSVLIPKYLFWLPGPIKRIIIEFSFEKLMDEYYKEIGIPSSQLEYLTKMKLYAKHLVKVYEGKKHMKINAKMALKDAMKMKGSSKKGDDIFGVCANISKWIGGRISSNEITIREFHSMINQINKG